MFILAALATATVSALLGAGSMYVIKESERSKDDSRRQKEREIDLGNYGRAQSQANALQNEHERLDLQGKENLEMLKIKMAKKK